MNNFYYTGGVVTTNASVESVWKLRVVQRLTTGEYDYYLYTGPPDNRHYMTKDNFSRRVAEGTEPPVWITQRTLDLARSFKHADLVKTVEERL